MQFVSLTNQLVASTLGHSIDFPAGVPRHVPKVMEKEVRAAGCVPESEVTPEVLAALKSVAPGIIERPMVPGGLQLGNPDDDTEDDVERDPAGTPTDPLVRKEKILAAFKMLKERGQRENFLANGVPHLKPLSGATGFRVTASERDTAWVEFMDPEGN